MKKALSVLLLLAMVLALCACGRTKVTCDQFISLMESKGYSIQQMEDAPEGGKGYVAFNEDETFVLYFYETGNKTYARNAYSHDLDSFGAIGGGGSSTRSSSEGFGCATRKTDDSFYISSYLDSTYMSGHTSADQADAMKKIFKELGYK